jgi:hypothetical protein
MRKMKEVELLNHVIEWIGDKVVLYEVFRLQHDLDFTFIAMGHGWIEFDLHLWDGSTLYMEAWVDREETEITINNRNPITNETELTFLDKIQLS